MAKIDKLKIKLNVLDVVSKNENIKQAAFELANEKFSEAKAEMLSDFDEHPITVEIEEGGQDPLGAGNSSGTLGGRGNLFTFIGFNIGSKPTKLVRSVLKNITKIYKKPTVKSNSQNISFSYEVKIPGIDEEIAEVAPMPWGTERSWVRGIEWGIRNLNSYIYWKLFSNSMSRSTAGLIAKNENGNVKNVRSGMTFERTSYLSKILRVFKEKLR